MRFAARLQTLRTAAAALTCIAILRAEAGFEQGFLDRSAVLETAARANTNNFPDAREVLVAGTLRVEANADATYTQWQEEYVAILTEQAREQRRTVSSHFTIPYQRGTQDCAVTLVEIIRSGSVIPVDVSMNSRVMVDPSSMSANIYNPNDKVLQVSIPGLEIGDILHTVFFDRVVQPRMHGTWSEWVPMEDTRPIMFQSVRFSLPEETPLRSIALKAPVAGTVTGRQSRADGRLVYEWEARDVPRMFPEPNMPPVHTVVQRLLVSTAPDWQTVSRWYWELSAPHLAPSPELTAKSRELAGGTTSRRDRIERIFRFVSQEIRYMGITVETTAPGYEPHDVKDTFAARHGVCRDKAALLVAMLREAGIEAFPTLIHTGALKDPEVPQPYFNHAIVAAREPDGSYLLMDPTDENTRDLLPAYLGHRSYLVATPEGETLRTSPVEPAERNMVHVETIASLDAGGRLEAETLLSFGGVNDGIYRGWFAQSRPEDRRRAVEGWAKSAAPGARVLDLRFQPAELTDTTVPLTVRFSYEAPDFAIPGRETRVLPVPSLGTSIGMVNFIVGNTGLKKRKYPLTTDIACGVSEKIRLSPGAAAGRALDLPAAVSREDDDLSWRRSFAMTNGTLVADSDFRLHSVEFAPSAYGKLKDVLAGIETASRALPVYAEPAEDREPADSIIESSSVVFDVHGRGKWTETRTFRKRVLSYAGRKSNSELKLNFNEAWEDVRIVSAVVTAPDGTCVSISTNEINLMDQPWVGAAPRYPHGRTLVAAFPAVQAGSVIECTFVRECRDRPFFAARETFAGPDPINAKSVFLTGPASGSVAAAVRDGEPGRGAAWAAVTASNGAWRTVNSPAVRNEEALPPWWSFTPSLTLSAGDWKLYSAEVNRRLVAAASARKSAAYAARGLVRGTRDPMERIRLIRDFVATRIRRAGPGLASLPLSAITPADRTLADGYGNSADRAVLLYAMLESAGLEPGFVLASGYPATAFFEERL
ncbi:MAG: DUF3857 domain-containing protein, partial [Lentisphaerae bacterium]|nr:DUF3857 domain-containing protein [Lentisphaerota bacterium]